MPRKDHQEKECLITKELCVRLPLDGYDKPLANSEATRVAKALVKICSSRDRRPFNFRGCEFVLEWPTENQRFLSTELFERCTVPSSLFVEGVIVIAPKDRRAQCIRLDFSLENGTPYSAGVYYVSCSGNPNAILTACEAGVATVADPETGVAEALPSSSRYAMQTVNRVFFELLNTLYKTCTGEFDELFEPTRQADIVRGDFEISKAKFRFFLPINDSSALFEQLLSFHLNYILLRDECPMGDESCKVGTSIDADHLPNGITKIEFYRTDFPSTKVTISKIRRTPNFRYRSRGNETASLSDTIQIDVEFDEISLWWVISAARDVVQRNRRQLSSAGVPVQQF